MAFTWDIDERSSREFHFVYFDVGDGRAKSAGPVDEPIPAKYRPVFVEADETLDYGAVQLREERRGKKQ